MKRDGGEQNDLLRAYLLGTLSEEETARLEARLADDEALRAALATEQERLEALGCLAEAAPPEGLAERTIRRVAEEAPAEEAWQPGFWALLPRAITIGLPLLVVCGLLVTALMHMRETSQRTASAGNLKQMGLICKMYAGENRGKFPPVAPFEGVWAPDLRVLYPNYITDPQFLVDPRLPRAKRTVAQLRDALAADPPRWEEACRIAARSYTYTGWSIRDASELPAVREDYQRMAKAGDFDRDIRGENSTVPRLREGVERFFITDINNPAAGAGAQSTIPIMFEVVYPPGDDRQPEGCNVLYMDGHVEYLPYGEAFPVLPAVAETFPPTTEP